MKIDKCGLCLETDRLVIRPVTPADITDEYVNGLNHPEVNRYLVAVRRTVQTRRSVEEFVRQNLADPASVLFGVFVRDEPQPLVGTVRVHEIDEFHFTAVVGICLFARRAWDKHYATETLRRIATYLFDELGLHYLEASVYAENTRGVDLFLRAGFERRFLVTEKYRHEDTFKPVVYVGRINPQFDMTRLHDK